MLAALPRAALLTADAGFVGYDFWRSLLDSRRHLLVRVGSNVKLLKKLGFALERDETVYLWPDRRAAQHPPLRLRLIVIHTGRHPLYLVTDLSAEQLSDDDATLIYGRRWGIELFFRHCKQTFERTKLRSQNPDNALVELEWSLLGMSMLGIHSHIQLLAQGVEPRWISFALVLRAYRAAIASQPESASS